MAKLREPGQPLTMEYIPASTVEPVVSVKESDTLERARTLMELHNFSQLPVLRGDRPKGVVSWESIGRALVRNPQAGLLECLDTDYSTVEITDHLLDVIPRINHVGYVLVKKANNTVSGIVTSADLGQALAAIAGPFLLLEQLETQLRKIFRSLYEMDQVSPADVGRFLPKNDKADDRNAEDFTLGELTTLLTHEQMWPRITSSYDRSTLQAALSGATQLRNSLMHFRSLSDESTDAITNLRGLVGILSGICKQVQALATQTKQGRP